MSREGNPGIDGDVLIARRMWREAGEAAKTGGGGENHMDLARALGAAGVPVNRLPDEQISREIRWHPKAIINQHEGEAAVMSILEQELSRAQVDRLLTHAGEHGSHEEHHEGIWYRLVMTSAKTRLEIRAPSMIARLRTSNAALEDRNPLHGLAVFPRLRDGGLMRELMYGRYRSGETCQLSWRFHRGVVAIAPNLLDALVVQAATGLAAWWLPAPPELGRADPIPHGFLVSRQITRVVLATPANLCDDWRRALRDLHPGLKLDHVAPTALDFPGLLRPHDTVDTGVISVRHDEAAANDARRQPTWLDALKSGGIDVVRRALLGPLKISTHGSVVVELDPMDRPELPGGPMEWAKEYLWRRFHAEGDRRWRLANVMRTWQVHTPTGWEERSQEEVERDAMVWLNRHCIKDAHGNPEPLRPTRSMMERFIRALEIETVSPAKRMPAWLPETVQRKGDEALPIWSEQADLLRPQKDPSIGRPPAEWLLAFHNGILDMQALRARRVEMGPHDPCYFGGPSIPYSLDTEMLRRMLDAVPDAVYGSEAWFLAQERILDLCREVAPDFTQALCEQYGDYGVEHMVDRFACARAALGDLMSWIRVWERVALLIGVRRAGKDTLQVAADAACGEASKCTINDFSELAGDTAMGPLRNKRYGIIPDGEFDRENDRKAMTTLKQISGRSSVRVRDLYERAVPDAKLSIRLWVCVNNMMQMRDASKALAERMVLIPYTQTFEGKTDDGLKDRVAREGPGIGLIGLVGFYEAWNRQPRPGLYHPRIAYELGMVDRLIRSSAPLVDFAEKFCHVGKECGPTTLETLYAAYRGAVAVGKLDAQHAVGFYRFCDELTHVAKLWPTGQADDGCKLYKGVALNDAGYGLVQVGEDVKAHRSSTSRPSSPWGTVPRGQMTLNDAKSGGEPDISGLPV